MLYQSTRGASEKLSFADAVLTGLAPDGGLYMPEEIPTFSQTELENMASMNYADLAFCVMEKFVGDSLSSDELKTLIVKSLANFRTKAITPLKQLDNNLFLLELFHGPTFAFKDIALQFLGNLLDLLLKKRNERGVVLGATSGDTGSAAIAGCAFCSNLDIFILHPHNGVSAMQRKQMTSWDKANIFNIAIESDFDNAQAIVKQCFNQRDFLQNRRLIAVNSINFARILAQSVYYFVAGLALGAHKGQKINFVVPSANFGDVFAGFLAHKMGLPIEKLTVATNANDILHRSISLNDFSKKALIKTLAPSMDIVVSSNFERLLFEVFDRDSKAMLELLNTFNSGKNAQIPLGVLEKIQTIFSSASFDDEQLLQGMRVCKQNSDELIDPHTASGYLAALEDETTNIKVVLATAHPAKFEQGIQQAGLSLEFLPEQLAQLQDKAEKFEVMPADAELIKKYILQNI